jgi:tRNA uridine 5-carboxymethylaminomethyl modification enzyme
MQAKHFDIIVVGGGHAGVEAAWAAAQLGASVALVTMQREAIGRMSCNPAIGGLGKGQMVREIDALGGLMGLAADQAGIQFRMLNRSKGPAVWAPRAQSDRHGYPRIVQQLLAQARNVEVIEGSVEAIETRDEGTEGRRDEERQQGLRDRGIEGSGDEENSRRQNIETSRRQNNDALTLPSPKGRGEQAEGINDHDGYREESTIGSPQRRIAGVRLADGRTLAADAVILTTGTFLRGLMHCGEEKTEGGRVGEASATGISAALASLGFELGRLKTGTPPRIHRDTIDYSRCEPQPGDEVPTPFSYMTDAITQPQVPCWVTWTNATVHGHIQANLHRAPMYSGQIQSTGPRYCPSIEDKVVRFADKPKHQVFLEPEGYDNERVYCNGISTSLPRDVQDAIVRDIPGLENAKILQYGYAVEYDFVPTHQTRRSLETKLVRNLFLAGQINGTSGYEEAAGQGIWAGINAVRAIRDEDPFVLGRDEAYLGVMIDDLVTRPPSEPYRMFTSRAEYRLRLRADNADQRLTPIGRQLSTVDDARWRTFQAKASAIAAIESLAKKGSVGGTHLPVWMKRPDVDLRTFAEAMARTTDRTFDAEHLAQALVQSKYTGYVERQDRQIDRFRKLETMAIPENTDYRKMEGLRNEAREKLARLAPSTLGQAARVSGVNPADITVVWIYLTGRRSLVWGPSHEAA